VNWDTFLEQLGNWLAENELLTPGQSWVVGVSGGPDSTLLIHALRDLRDRHGLKWELHVAHLHHGLRGADADADFELVAALAGVLDLPFHHERTDVRTAVQEEGGSTEEVARERRYELERVALKTGSDYVAVAHHADDDAETILHRICRGTGLRGLAGMRPVRPIQPGSRVMLVRPLLAQRRSTIEALCRDMGFEYRTDPTNLSTEFTRGRIRNVILPLLRTHLNPNVAEALLRLGEQARRLGTYLENAAARTFESLIVAEGPRFVSLNTRALLSKQKIIQAEVVRRALVMVAGAEQDLGFPHIEAVLRLAAEKASGKELHLPGPAIVRKQYDRLEFRPLSEPDSPPQLVPVFIACPGRTELPLLGVELSAEVCDVTDGKIAEIRRRRNPYEEWLDYDRLRFPLLVRGRRDGDRFWPLGAPGSKSVGDFLSDEKIEPALRARTGVLCDQDGPVWIMPLRIDERAKLRETTRRALRLMLCPVGKQPPAEGR
jgi:tRNA(Ile)-lysidine synthase